MLTVYKYELKPGLNKISMPDNAIPLGAQSQHGKPQLWALVDTEVQLTDKIFLVVGTGEPIEIHPARLNFLSTFQLDEWMVFHLFEVVA